MRRRARAFLIVAGVLFLGASAIVTNASIEAALGRAPGALAWGPALFRLLAAFHGLVLLAFGLRFPGSQAGIRENLPPAPRYAWATLSLLTVAALALRLFRLDAGLWLDEVLTLLDFVRPPLGEIVSSFRYQNQHMLYSILAHASVGVFGESAWALRLPAVLFGVASIWALFLLAVRLVGVREALLACALMTFSYHHVWFSQNARGYTGLLLFAILATWLWLEALRREAWPWWILYAVTLFLGFWVQVAMVFVPAAHGLVFLWLLIRGRLPRPRSGWRPVAAWALAAGLTLQVYSLSLPEFLREALHEVSPPSEWTNPVWMVRESVRSLRLGFSGAAAALAGGGLALLGWAAVLRRDRVAGAVMILPALLGGATIVALGHNLWPRFFFFSMGFALLFVIHGAVTAARLLPAKSSVRAAAGLALSCVMIAASAATLPRCYNLPKQDFIGARDYVERSRRPRDAVVTVGLATRVYSDYYAPEWGVVETRAQLDALRRGGSVWLVYTLPFELKATRPGIWSVIERDFTVVRVFAGTLGGGEVYVCRSVSGRDPPGAI